MDGTLPGSPEVLALLGGIISDLIADLEAAGQRAAQAYADGLAEGIQRGRRIGEQQAARELTEHWEHAARMVKAYDSPWKERRERQLQAARPRPGDYTGQLSAEEYFGTGGAPVQ